VNDFVNDRTELVSGFQALSYKRLDEPSCTYKP